MHFMRFMWHALSVICSKSKESSENENEINSRRLTQTPQTFYFILARTSADFIFNAQKMHDFYKQVIFTKYLNNKCL